MVQSGLPDAGGARWLLGQRAGPDALVVARARGRGQHQRADRLPRGARDLAGREEKQLRRNPFGRGQTRRGGSRGFGLSDRRFILGAVIAYAASYPLPTPQPRTPTGKNG